ncbi:MAG: hypothetical protein D6735_15980 [Acidobacteria bacterium]|nr:MAG: hypothetical protein D6735_15980 [Acidobacteriota bacterium]
MINLLLGEFSFINFRKDEFEELQIQIDNLSLKNQILSALNFYLKSQPWFLQSLTRFYNGKIPEIIC